MNDSLPRSYSALRRLIGVVLAVCFLGVALLAFLTVELPPPPLVRTLQELGTDVKWTRSTSGADYDIIATATLNSASLAALSEEFGILRPGLAGPNHMMIPGLQTASPPVGGGSHPAWWLVDNRAPDLVKVKGAEVFAVWLTEDRVYIRQSGH